MHYPPETQAQRVSFFGVLVLIMGGIVTTAQAARTTASLTAAQATACIQAAVTAHPGMITKVEAESKGDQQFCEVRIVDVQGKKFKMQIDANTNQVMQTK